MTNPSLSPVDPRSQLLQLAPASRDPVSLSAGLDDPKLAIILPERRQSQRLGDRLDRLLTQRWLTHREQDLARVSRGFLIKQGCPPS